jgi:hypothetical protein
MFKQWAKAVFWNNTAKSFWTFGCILSAVFCLTPIATRFPQLRFIVPLCLFTIGFFASSYLEYVSLTRKLKQITTASHRYTLAGEMTNLPTECHTVVVDIYLIARNQSSDGNSIRVHTCSLNVPGASLNYLQFIEEDAGDNTYHRQSDVLNIQPKSETKPVVKAVFILTGSPYPVPQDNVCGHLEIIDIHDCKHDVEYSALLARNAPITGSM